MKAIVKQMFTVSYIIVYVLTLTPSAKGNNHCNVRSQHAQQCACVSKNTKSRSSCKWAVEELIFTEETQEGFFDVNLPNLQTCNSTDYRIRLLVNEAVVDSDVCHRNFNNVITFYDNHWKKHSEIKYKVYNFQQCLSSTIYSNMCNEFHNNSIPTVTFDYIFSGCYILQIFDKTVGFLYQSHATYMSSNYKKKRLDNDVIGILTPRFTERQEFEISIKLNSTYFIKPPSIRTNLMRKDCKQDCIALSSMTQVTYNVKDFFKEYNNTFIRCNELFNITLICSYSEKELKSITWYICTYTGLSAGRYKYEYSLLEEYTRCNEDTIWADPGYHNSCDKWAYIDVPEIKPNNITKSGVPTEADNVEYIIIPTLIVIILVCIILKILHKKYFKYRHQNQATLEPQYQYLTGENLYLLNTKEDKTLNTQEIFIIYARDSEWFTTMMESFKELLGSVDKNVSVHDINVHDEAMCDDPENWIRNKISNENIKFILFLNNCGLIIFENQVMSEKRPTIAYKNAKWQDNMFTYAIKQLQSADAINYTNLFVCTFCNTSAFGHINPGTRFLMPNSIEKLLEHLFPNVIYFNESFLNDFNDNCRKYNQFCEENSDYVNYILKLS